MTPLEERVAWLEAVSRSTLEALRQVASLGDFQAAFAAGEGPGAILDETCRRLGQLVRVHVQGLFLVDESSGEFRLARHCPPGETLPDARGEKAVPCLAGELEAQAEAGQVALTLDRRKALLVPAVSAAFQGRDVLLHDISTASRVRGLCLVVLEEGAAHIPDATIQLVSILLRSMANCLESEALYALVRQKNADLERQLEAVAQSRRQALAAEARYRNIFEHAGVALCLAERDGRILQCNTRWEQLLGHGPGEGVVSLREILGPHAQCLEETPLDPAAAAAANAVGAVSLLTGRSRECRILRPDGQERVVVLNMAAVPAVVIAQEGSLATAQLLVAMLDVTDAQRLKRDLHQRETLFHTFFRNNPAATALLGPDGAIRHVNPAFVSLFGHPEQEVVGREIMDLLTPPALRAEAETMRGLLLSGQAVHFETLRLHRSGRERPVHVLAYPVLVDGQVESLCYTFQDISERKRYEEQLAHQAFHDSLTGLPNRGLIMERLGRALERSWRRDDYRFALLLVDLDRFKTVNDSLGHLAGDALLVEIGARLRQCVRGVDTVARLGGDEFAILLEEFGHPREVSEVARRIQKTMGAPVLIDKSRVYSSASVGVVLKTRDYRTPEDILRDADIAMYKAKARGAGQFRVFNRAMRAKTMESLQLEQDLRQAVAQGRLAMVYQPIHSLPDRRLAGFEALLRWPHPTRGLLGPDCFIHLAEECGCILALGKWVIHAACAQLMRWRRELGPDRLAPVSVNVSGQQLRQTDFVDQLREALDIYQIPPRLLKVEITESTMLDDSMRTASVLERCRELGVPLMLDDFGMGYSSLSQLHQFPMDYLKIDKSFISGAATGGRSDDAARRGNGGNGGNGEQGREGFAIARTIISLAKAMNMRVVAEGVEHEDQLLALEGLGCHAAQGWYFSRPLSPEAAGQRLASAGPSRDPFVAGPGGEVESRRTSW